MIATTPKFQLAVYNKEPYHLTARHFLPAATIKLVDISGEGVVNVSDKSFYSEEDDVQIDTNQNDVLWGTLEDYQFLLSSTAVLMPDSTEDIQAHNNGWVTDIMTDADGNFVEDCWLDIRYQQQKTSIGKTIYFDDNYDSVPVDFDIIYYRAGVEIARDRIRGNTQYIVVSLLRVAGYDRVTLIFTNMSRPYRRMHMLVDMSGIIMDFEDTDITSLSILSSVDVTGETLDTGETDIGISNQSHGLDILNKGGFEGYLQKKQPVDFSLYQIFPDGTRERVWMGSWLMYDWKAKGGGMDASFTIRNSLELLTQGEYRKGAFIDSGATLGSLMEELFADLGIVKYQIDNEFYQVTTTIPLPIATHKELLRQLAQAGQGVVLPTRAGGFHVKYISPLVTATNLFLNPIFNGSTNWTLTDCALSTDYVFSGLASVLMTNGSSLMQTVSIIAGHHYYVRLRIRPTGDYAQASGHAYVTFNGVIGSTDIVDISSSGSGWAMFTALHVATSSGSLSVGITYDISVSAYIDSLMIIDLTDIYGAGHEPDQEWCDSYIRDILDTLPIPKYVEDSPVDHLDYSILINPPDIQFNDPIGSVSTKIHTLTTAAESSEICKGTRMVRGTQEFDIDLGGMARNCTISLSGSGASLLAATWYAQSVHVKIKATGDVSWVINGYRVSDTTSDYVITPDLDPHLVPSAASKSSGNVFIDTFKKAETLASYLAYWLERRFSYSFKWRQNPAVEILDPVMVQDDYDNNNVVLITEQNIEYTGGVLGGSSKGVV